MYLVVCYYISFFKEVKKRKKVKYKVAVIGSGSWGTAVACAFARNGHDVILWARREEMRDSINMKHENVSHLPGYPLPHNLLASCDMNEACEGADVVIIASPSLYLVETVKQVISALPLASEVSTERLAIIGILTKGFVPNEEGTPRLIVETLEHMFPPSYVANLVYISGPSHGEEVVMGAMTGLIAASINPMASIRCREALRGKTLLVYSSLDVVGVQVCAAIKNVIAIAFGVLDAISSKTNIVGDNTRSLLLAAGLNEIQIIGAAMGATHAETFTSIAGVGDLEVTCRSKYGRNRRFGFDIVNTGILDAFTGIKDLIANIEKVGYLPEGVMACNYVHKISEKEGLKLPICEGVYKILDKKVQASEYIKQIMNGDV